MSDPFIAEIVMFGGNFAPRGWAFCSGQLLPISQNDALFSIVGTTYGGDGRTTFALPDLRGRSPKHPGDGPGLRHVRVGQRGGQEEHTLTVAEMPSHNHSATLQAERKGATHSNPNGRMLAANIKAYCDPIGTKTNFDLHTDSIAVNSAGGQQPFGLESPYLAVNFIIALQGVYPSRS